MDLLHKYLCNADDRVEISTYISFVTGCSGPFDAFQRVCDPGTVVLCTGVVDDTTERNSPEPYVIHSLLGLRVVQVACGGQHAAVLSSQGHVFTWGRGGFGRLGHGNTRPSEVPLLVEALKDQSCTQVTFRVADF